MTGLPPDLRDKVQDLVQELMEENEQKQKDSKQRWRADSPEARLRRREMRFALGFAVAVILGGLTYFIVTRPNVIPIPEGAMGSWQTDAPRYAGRAFTITDSTLTLYVSPTDSVVHPILQVTGSADQLSTLVEIEYTDFGESNSFAFYFSADTVIRFVNQREMAWHKVAELN